MMVKGKGSVQAGAGGILAAALVGFYLLLAPAGPAGAAGTTAWISMERQGNAVVAVALCRMEDEAALSYEFTAERVGTTNSSRSVQRGKRHMLAGETAILSTLSTSSSGGEWLLRLLVSRDGETVAKDDVRYPLEQ